MRGRRTIFSSCGGNRGESGILIAMSKKKTASPAAGVKPWEHAKSGQGSGTDPLAARFVESLSFDRRLYRHDIQGSIAHARMLCMVNLITAEELAAIERGLQEIAQEIEAAGPDHGAAWPGWKVELEDVHMCIEAALIEKIGDPGRKLHTGRSRNDQVALDLKLWVEEASLQAQARIDTLLRAFLSLSEKQGHLVMPSYTHLQRAQPIVLGGELLAWMEAFDRAGRRIGTLGSIIPRNPLGSGAIAGSSLPLNRQALAGMLPLAGPTPNAIDATATRDSALDSVYILSMMAMTLSRWAEQWILYASTEFGFLTLDERYTTGSSMMPQKRNPDMLELIRGRCGNVYGNLVALLTIMKGLPIGYNRDLQEDKRHLFAAFDVTMDSLEMAARIVSTARFNEKRIAATLDRGFLDATSLAEYFVTRGVPFRTAHQLVGAMVRQCESEDLMQLSDLSIETMKKIGAQVLADRVMDQPLCDETVYDWLGAENVVKRYQTYGNAGLNGWKEQSRVWHQRLEETTVAAESP